MPRPRSTPNTNGGPPTDTPDTTRTLPPGPPPPDPDEEAARADARHRLLAVKAQIQAKSMELLAAEPADMLRLTHDLQRLRVAMLMLREIVEDVADPTTYRELSLLNKMINGHDPEQEALRREQLQGELEATERIASVGLTPSSAGSMVRVLQSLQQVMQRHTPPDEETPQ